MAPGQRAGAAPPDHGGLIRSHPGGGQYDCLRLFSLNDGSGVVMLNRVGTIQVHDRFDGRTDNSWSPTTWEEYYAADPRRFLHRLEAAAGLPGPHMLPAATPRTLTYRVLAAIAATAFKSVHPIEIQQGFIDSSGDWSGDNAVLDEFTAIPLDLRRPRPDDLLGHAGYRFWIVHRDGAPILALEQSQGLAWTLHHTATFSVVDLYKESRRHLLVTALKLLRRVDHV